MRPVMIRPRKGLASRIVPIMRNGPSATVGSGTCLSTRSRSGAKTLVLRAFRIDVHPAIAARTVEDREVELLVGRVEVGEEVEDFVDDFFVAAVRTVDLVDRDDRAKADLQRLGDDELGLRHRAFGGVDQNDRAVHHREDTLDFAAEVGVAGVSTMLMRTPFHSTEVALARMVMPRSFSRSLLSMTRSATRWFSRNEPDCFRSSSTRVVLPWSTCAMIAMLRSAICLDL